MTARLNPAYPRAPQQSRITRLPDFLVRRGALPVGTRPPAAPAEHRIDIPPERFGARVAARRQELRMSQTVMIDNLNRLMGTALGRTSISTWENGHAEPSLRVIRGVARVLTTRPEYLAFGVRAGGMPVEHYSRVH